VTEAPRIALVGATGRTGNAVAHALAARTDVALVACVAPSVAGGSPTRPLPTGVPASAALDDVDAAYDVLVDLGVAGAVSEHLAIALEAGAHAVVGTTGLPGGLLEQWGQRYAAVERGLLHVPNFSIGAVLMMQFAERAAALLADAEIVELHHDTKVDAPSGTALRTAELIATARGAQESGVGASNPADGTSAARGLAAHGVPVHSMRLPGATAHQEVVFGAPGELLTIRHDAINRSCYGAGVALAARKVADYRGLSVGLEL
jgi:4-hydroxy-tetrahydrodipicolinate reductase